MEVWGWIKKHIIMVLLIILGIFLVLTYTTYGRKYKEAQEMLANSGNEQQEAVSENGWNQFEFELS